MRALKYLVLMVDKKFTFWIQLCNAADKADTLVVILSRLMPNIAGPRSSNRRALLSNVHLIMLYGAEVRTDRLKVDKYRNKLVSVQRKGALGVGCAYRVVSGAAIMVLAGIIPLDLLAAGRKMIYETKIQGETDKTEGQERT